MKTALRGVLFLLSLMWAAGILLLFWYRYEQGDLTVFGYYQSAADCGIIENTVWGISRNAVSLNVFLLTQGVFLLGLFAMFLGKKSIAPVLTGMLASVFYIGMNTTACFKLTKYLGEGVIETVLSELYRGAASLFDRNLPSMYDLFESFDGYFWDVGGFFAGLAALFLGVMYLTKRAGDRKKQNKTLDIPEPVMIKKAHEAPGYEAEAVRKKPVPAETYVIQEPAPEEAPYEAEKPYKEEATAQEPAATEVPTAAEEPATDSAVIEEPTAAEEPVIEPAQIEEPITIEEPAAPRADSVRRTNGQYDPEALSRLRKLAELYKMGILTEEEFTEKKKELLRSI